MTRVFRACGFNTKTRAGDANCPGKKKENKSFATSHISGNENRGEILYRGKIKRTETQFTADNDTPSPG